MALLAMASSISDSISMLLVLAVVMNQPPKCVTVNYHENIDKDIIGLK